MRNPLKTNATAVSLDLTGLTPELLNVASVAVIGDSTRGGERAGTKVNIQYEMYDAESADSEYRVAVKMLAEDALVAALNTLHTVLKTKPGLIETLVVGWPETSADVARMLTRIALSGEPEVAQPDPSQRPIRDVLAEMLRERGYTHDDETDPDDMFWQGPTLGIRPMLGCVGHEMNRDLAETEPGGTPGWHTYSVSVAVRTPVDTLGEMEPRLDEPVNRIDSPILRIRSSGRVDPL